jgi:hypothetical protein
MNGVSVRFLRNPKNAVFRSLSFSMAKRRGKPFAFQAARGGIRNMKAATSAVLALFVVLLASNGSLAQGGMGRGPRSGGRMYDPKTVETLSGEVVSVEHIQGKGRGLGRGGRGTGYGVHLILKTDKEEIPVHLGPGWYLNKQALKIAAKDRIEVRGSRITFEGKPAIIAAEVKKGEKSLRLRDDTGAPEWRGGKR